MKENPKLKKLFLKAVREQMDSPETPYVREHYNRLINEGHSKDEVMKMLGCVLVSEMWDMNNEGRSFDEATYIKRLEQLPDTSFLDE